MNKSRNEVIVICRGNENSTNSNKIAGIVFFHYSYAFQFGSHCTRGHISAERFHQA